MVLRRLAAGLVFVAGIALLRLAVTLESWPLLGLGLAAAVFGLGWFVLSGPGSAGGREPAVAQLSR